MVDVLNFTYRELKSDQVQQLSNLSQLKSARRDYAVTYADIRRTASNEVDQPAADTVSFKHAANHVHWLDCMNTRKEGVWEGQYTKLRFASSLLCKCTYKPFT